MCLRWPGGGERKKGLAKTPGEAVGRTEDPTEEGGDATFAAAAAAKGAAAAFFLPTPGDVSGRPAATFPLMAARGGIAKKIRLV